MFSLYYLINGQKPYTIEHFSTYQESLDRVVALKELFMAENFCIKLYGPTGILIQEADKV